MVVAVDKDKYRYELYVAAMARHVKKHRAICNGNLCVLRGVRPFLKTTGIMKIKPNVMRKKMTILVLNSGETFFTNVMAVTKHVAQHTINPKE